MPNDNDDGVLRLPAPDPDRYDFGDGSSSSTGDEVTVGFGERIIRGVRRLADGLRDNLEPLAGCSVCGEGHHPMNCPDKPKSTAKSGLFTLPARKRSHSPDEVRGEGQCRECGAPTDVPCNYWSS